MSSITGFGWTLSMNIFPLLIFASSKKEWAKYIFAFFFLSIICPFFTQAIIGLPLLGSSVKTDNHVNLREQFLCSANMIFKSILLSSYFENLSDNSKKTNSFMLSFMAFENLLRDAKLLWRQALIMPFFLTWSLGDFILLRWLLLFIDLFAASLSVHSAIVILIEASNILSNVELDFKLGDFGNTKKWRQGIDHVLALRHS